MYAIAAAFLLLYAFYGCGGDNRDNYPGYIIIDSTPVEQAVIGKTWRYQIDAYSSLCMAITYSLDCCPAGMSQSGGWLYWTPSAAQEGWNNVTLSVTDGVNQYTQFFKINAFENTGINHAPAITSAPNLLANAGDVYTYDVGATDIDDNPLIFEIAYADAKAVGININSSSGAISWTPAVDLAGNSVHIVVTVKDDVVQGQLFDEQEFNIAVLQKPSVPTIVSPSENCAYAERSYTYRIVASDADNDALTYSLPVKPSGMTLDSNASEITWTPGAGDLGNHAVILRVSDGAYTAVQNFTVTVCPADALRFDTAPDNAASVGVEWTYLPEVVNAANASVTYSLPLGPASMTIDGPTGALSWTPGSGDAGFEPVVIEVTDGVYMIRQGFVIVVSE